MSGGIENDIWSNMESADTSLVGSDQDGTGVDTTLDDADNSLQQQVNQRQQPSAEDDNLTDPLNKNGNQPDKRNQRPDPNKEKGKTGPRTNDRGDLVDEQGRVIASAGRERRLVSENERLKSHTTQLRTRNEDLVRQIADAKVLNGMPQQYGLSNDDVNDALQIAALYTKNPIQAVRTLAQKAMAQGIELTDIFDDQTLPQLGVKATKDMLDQRLKPFETEQKSKADVNTQAQAGVEAANRFLIDYPDADVHQTDIANLMVEVLEDYSSRGMKIDPYIAAEKAWDMLQAFGAEHGFDMSQPIKPQVEAKSRNGSNSTQRPNGGQPNAAPRNQQPGEQRRTRPLPNGVDTSSQVVTRRSRTAPTEDNMGSIVRESMIEAGYNFNQ